MLYDKKHLQYLLQEDSDLLKESDKILNIIIHIRRKTFADVDSQEEDEIIAFKKFAKFIEKEDIDLLAQFKQLAPFFRLANPQIYNQIIKLLEELLTYINKYKSHINGTELNFIHQLLNKLIRIFSKEFRISLFQVIIQPEESYRDWYYEHHSKDSYFSPAWSWGRKIYVMEDYFEKRFLKYVRLHEATEYKFELVGDALFKYYEHVPKIIEKEGRAHEIATYKELMYARRNGELNKYYLWMKKKYKHDLTNARDKEEKIIIEKRWDIKEKIYQHIKHKPLSKYF